MPCKADVRKAVYDQVMTELVEGRYTFSRLDDNSIQINGKVDNSKTKAQSRQQAIAIAKQVLDSANKSFNGHVTGYITNNSAYDPITVTFKVSNSYVDHVYDSMPVAQQNDAATTYRNAEQERSFVNSDSGARTYEQLNLFAPTVTVPSGPYAKYIQFKRGQVSDINRRLGQIEVKKKATNITVAELTKLRNLERDLKLKVNGNFDLGIKGIKQDIEELEKAADISAVASYVAKDLKRLGELVKSNSLDDLNEAEMLIEFYDEAGTFKLGKENPFFSEDDIFLQDSNGNITSHYRLADTVRAQYEAWRSIAMGFQNQVNKKKEDLVVETVNADPSVIKTYGPKKFTFNELLNTGTGLKDADWLSMWTMDITQGIASHNGILPQVMFSALSNTIEKKSGWARSIEERIDKLNPKVQEELMKLDNGKYSLRGLGILGLKGASYNLFKEITKEGNETGGIVERFTNEFKNELAKAANAFRSSFEAAKGITDPTLKAKAFNKAFEEHKRWKRNNTIILDITKLEEIASDPTMAEFNATADPAYKQTLIDVLGQKGYKEAVDKQKSLLVKYQSERQSMIETLLIHENKTVFTDLSAQSKEDFHNWDNVHSPLKGHEDYNNVTGVFVGNRKINSYMDYNHFVARKNKVTITANPATNKYEFIDTTTPTGNYSDEFSKIESNPVLSDFYDIVKEVCETIRENMPHELQQKMAVNTLPGLMKTSMEIIADKNTGVMNAMWLSFRNMWEKLRLSFGVHKQSEISYAQNIDGNNNYKVNDGFLKNNATAVGQRMTIEKTKFLQAFNSTITNTGRLDKIRRFTILPISRFNTETLVLLAQYTHTDISLADIKAGNINAIIAKTGNNVEIGRIIKDFSLHSVVQSQSFDLGKLTKYFSNATMLYAARQEALPILELIKKHYETIKQPDTNNINNPIYNVIHGKHMQVGVRTNANRQMDNWFERVALDNYGAKHNLVMGKEGEDKLIGKTIYSVEEREKINEINDLIAKEKAGTNNQDKIDELNAIKAGLGRVRTGTALIDNVLAWVRTLRLGYNLSSGITNFLEGFTSNMIIGSSDQYFDPKELFYGYGVIKHSFLKNISFGRAETAVARKNRRLMDKFNVIMDSKNELQKSSVKTISSKLSWMNPHELNQRVEYINQSPLMIAILRSTKLKDVNGNEDTVWNAFDKDGHLKTNFKTPENISNWEELTGDDYLTFKQKLNKVIVLAHGNYDTMRGMMAKSGSGGKAVMMFKTWIPNALYQRFAVQQDDIQAGTIGYKGKYFSYTPTTAAFHGAIVGAAALGPVGLLAGLAVGGVMSVFKLGVRADIGILQESIEATKMLAKKAIGMPVNSIVGRNIIGIGSKGFDSWVGKGNFTQQDANNLKSNMSDIAMQLAWIALILVTKSIFWDDDDKADDPERITHNILVNRLMQLSSQAAMYVNPVEMYNSTFKSLPLTQYLADVGKFALSVRKWANGEDTLTSGVNSGESRMGNAAAKILLPGIFKDHSLGFGSQAEKVFTESPWHDYFRSDAHNDQVENKGDRASFRDDLDKQYKLEDFDGDTPEEQEKAKKKQIRKEVDERFPTPTKLKKLGETREEYEAEHTAP